MFCNAGGFGADEFANITANIGNLRCLLLLRMYSIREGSRWLSEDYQSGELKDRSILSKEDV